MQKFMPFVTTGGLALNIKETVYMKMMQLYEIFCIYKLWGEKLLLSFHLDHPYVYEVSLFNPLIINVKVNKWLRESSCDWSLSDITFFKYVNFGHALLLHCSAGYIK